MEEASSRPAAAANGRVRLSAEVERVIPVNGSVGGRMKGDVDFSAARVFPAEMHA